MGVSDFANHHMFSDASGSFGCGAWWNGRWFQLNWPENCKLGSIACEGSATEQKWCPGFQDLKISLGSQDFYGISSFH